MPYFFGLVLMRVGGCSHAAAYCCAASKSSIESNLSASRSFSLPALSIDLLFWFCSECDLASGLPVHLPTCFTDYRGSFCISNSFLSRYPDPFLQSFSRPMIAFTLILVLPALCSVCINLFRCCCECINLDHFLEPGQVSSTLSVSLAYTKF